MDMEPERKKTRGRPRLDGADKPVETVQALDRAFRLLTTLAKHDQLTLTELTTDTGMAPSTAHRLLITMQRHGIVAFNEEAQRWMVGVETFRIGSSFVRRTNVVQASRAIMRELMEETGETANLAIADNGDVVFISQVETHEAIRAFFRPGSRSPMHTSGIGKALLAEFRRDDVEAILQERGLPSFTPNTITSAETLFADLEETRKRGWSFDDEERNIGMRCLAAPIYNEFGEVAAGISISGPTVRMSDDRLDELGPEVRRAAAKITADIGGMVPDRS